MLGYNYIIMLSLHTHLSQVYYNAWLLRKRLDGVSLSERLSWFQANERKTPAQIAELRWRLMGDLLEHAAAHSPYYRELFQRMGAHPRELLSPQTFAQIPLLDRATLNAERDRLAAENRHRRSLQLNSTGGSTGVPTRYYHDLVYAHQSAALQWRNQLWTGWRFGEGVVKVWGSAYDLRLEDQLRQRLMNFLRNTTVLPAYQITPDHLRAWPSVLRRRRPALLLGYTNALIALAQTGAPMHDISLKGVVTTAETLFPSQRRLLEETFGCRVFNRYGCRELSTIAHECAHGSLHINEDWVYAEVVDERGSPVTPGAVGQLALTGFFTHAMPFIRYAIQDAASFSERDDPCPCGLPFRRFERVEGKIQDLILLPGGGYVSGEFFAGVLRRHPVRQFQVRQPEPDLLEVYLVPEQGYTVEDEAEMRQVILRQCPGVHVRFFEAEDFPPTPSGNRRLTISLVSGVDRLYGAPHPEAG